ncbi:hypothetical protein [Microbacterium flavescens]|jgi:hypothetical protein|uniref:hypothetical protein n=1 Tax=Microbacterium flavescens TaxID=69366 RepID=UPI001BDE66FA|nr:hypothetical protein [Microbacterium flavescens]
MKRIDIVYGGEHYSVGGRDLDSLRDEIEKAVAGGVGWITVNDGEGAPRWAHLLLTAGVPLAVIPIPDDAPEVAGGSLWDSDGNEVHPELRA